MDKKTKKNILIVEDDKDMAQALILFADQFNFESVVDITGETCLEKARANKPHLILLDLNLPTTNGLEILKELKKDNSLSKIPVIVFSSINDEKKAREAIALGASAYFCKTSPIQALFEIVREYTREEVLKRNEK